MMSVGQCDNYSEVIALFSLLLGCSMRDLETTLDTIVSMSTVSRNEWNSVLLTTNSPKRNRTIIDLGPMCYHQTRFSCKELQRMMVLFFGEYNSGTYIFKKIKILV